MSLPILLNGAMARPALPVPPSNTKTASVSVATAGPFVVVLSCYWVVGANG